ncbi:MAG TPA: NUDIX hydrolase [Alphaproteobacteria bacterium]|nr:NUDIX hydrolase [Alphaproteobacteria bacterium]
MPRKSKTKPAAARAPVATAVQSRRYPERPMAGIGVVIWRGDKVLLVKRKNAPRVGEWGLPGGAQKIGETIMEAAVREAREETGLDIAPLGIVTALDAITRDRAGKIEYHYTLIEIAAEAGRDEEGGQKARAGSDVSEVRWARLDEVEKLCAWPEVARVVRLSLLQRAL